jgi:hypothetical protein
MVTGSLRCTWLGVGALLDGSRVVFLDLDRFWYEDTSSFPASRRMGKLIDRWKQIATIQNDVLYLRNPELPTYLLRETKEQG